MAFYGLERALWELHLPHNQLTRIPSDSLTLLKKLSVLNLAGKFSFLPDVKKSKTTEKKKKKRPTQGYILYFYGPTKLFFPLSREEKKKSSPKCRKYPPWPIGLVLLPEKYDAGMLSNLGGERKKRRKLAFFSYPNLVNPTKMGGNERWKLCQFFVSPALCHVVVFIIVLITTDGSSRGWVA